ncbi:VOC family protein [Vibrio sp. RC27]
MTHHEPNFEFSPVMMIDGISLFSNKIDSFMKILGLDVASLNMDHVAMRINQHCEAQRAESEWAKMGEVISRAEINGRPIVVVELNQPIVVGKWQTDCVELPYPAKGKTYPIQGWEHVEFVIPCRVDSMDEFVTFIRHQFPHLNRCWDDFSELGVSVKMSEPKASGERLPNPTIAFKWSGVTIKLHPHALKTVILSEQSPLFT